MIEGGTRSPRRLTCWIDSFVELTAGRETPLLFRKWAGISCLAAALERRVHTNFFRMELFPNLYVMLVGLPGIGKGVAVNPAVALWQATERMHIAPTSMSKASLIDAVNEAKKETLDVPTYNALAVPVREFGSFLPSYDGDFLAALTDIFDGFAYRDKKRTKKLDFTIERPLLNILGGCTPDYLKTTFPEGAWAQGFASRTIMIYSGEQVRLDPFAYAGANAELFHQLAADLIQVTEIHGVYEWTSEAKAAIASWHKSGGQPAPSHPRLASYVQRRTTHLAKLCMTASAARSNQLVIDIEAYTLALGWLTEAEGSMPGIFEAMGGGGDSAAMSDATHHVGGLASKNGGHIPEAVVVKFLSQRIPSHNIMRVIEMMMRSGMIELVGVDVKGMRVFRLTKTGPNG